MPWTLRTLITISIIIGAAEALFRTTCDLGKNTSRLARRSRYR